MPAKKKVTDVVIDERKKSRTFTCIVGCNVPGKDGECRYESGDQIQEKDVSPQGIKDLLEMNAIVEDGNS